MVFGVPDGRRLVAGEGHALLRHPRWWHRFIVDSVDEILNTPLDV